MLETVLMYLNNWFAVGRYDDTYTIEDGNYAALSSQMGSISELWGACSMMGCTNIRPS